MIETDVAIDAPMHTCFAWVGTGAFVSRSRVLSFLDTTSELAYGREELSHADNSFTTLQNDPSMVLSSDLVQLPHPFGHSDGEGIARNKMFIVSYFVFELRELMLMPRCVGTRNRTTSYITRSIRYSSNLLTRI